MSTADAAKKFGFSRASGFEDFRDRLMEQLAVGSEKILGSQSVPVLSRLVSIYS